MALAVEEMLYQLSIAYPALYGMLSIQSATIVKFDITYSSRVDSPMQVRQLIDYMSRVSNGHTKPTKSKSLKQLAIGAVKIAVLYVKNCIASLRNICRSLMIIKARAAW